MNDSLIQLQQSIQPHLDQIKAACLNNRETIAVAESVTSGCIQLLLSTCEGALDFFQGGMTAYNCSQKAIHLNVEPIFAEGCNGVDASIAVTMAQNVCKAFRSQIGVAITGYATPITSEGITDLYAYIAIVRNGEVIAEEKLKTSKEGIAAQWDYADKTIKKLAECLT